VLAESITVLAESIAVESEAVSDLFAVPLQEAKATVKANPKKANLNEFFILILLNFIKISLFKGLYLKIEKVTRLFYFFLKESLHR